jgi:acetyl-CoA carboxylase carboxyltransferase component
VSLTITDRGNVGVVTRLTTSRIDAIRKAREWMSALPTSMPKQIANPDSRPPRYSPEDLLYLVDPDIRKPFDMKEVILRLVDDSRFSTFKPAFGANLMTGFAQIFGRCRIRSEILERIC